MKIIIKIFSTFVLSVLMILISAGAVAASVPYENYTYNYQGKACAEPNAYVPKTVVTGKNAGTSDFSSPQDLFIAENENIYIADTGNNRIVVLSSEFKFLYDIVTFSNNGVADSFSNPSGIYVTDDNRIYVADTDNGRIVELDSDNKVLRILKQPQDDLSFTYAPTKVAVDFADRVYVLSNNCSQGVIEYDYDGTFLGYFGAVKTQSNKLMAFWKSIATDAQKEAMAQVIPTEYSNIDIDSKSFIYGTVSAIDTENFNTSMFIHRLNSMGNDVLKRNGFTDPMGDVDYIKKDENGKADISQLCDIATQANGVYSALDANKGRIFTYSNSGDLLYVYGAIGDSLGSFGTPVAIDVTEKNESLVLDSKYNQFTIFEPTEYVKLMLEAIEKYAKRDYDASADLWMKALRYTSESSVVFNQIGNVYNNSGEYTLAMKYYKLAYNNDNYSTAFEYARGNVIERNFAMVMTVLVLIVALVIIVKLIRKRKFRKGGQI